MKPKAPRWAWIVATGMGSGRLRPAPGTWGSLAGLAAWCLLSLLLATPFSAWVLGHRNHPHLAACIYAAEALFMLAPLAMSWLAVRAADQVLLETGDKDPGYIVADEWAGMWIILWPMRWEIAQNLHRLFGPSAGAGCRRCWSRFSCSACWTSGNPGRCIRSRPFPGAPASSQTTWWLASTASPWSPC